jgi:hypothetical protein
MADSTGKIVAFMGAAVAFSILSYEISEANGTKAPPFSPAKALIGATFAAALLSLLADSGTIGETLGVGLAGTAASGAILVNGAPVWSWITTYIDASTPVTQDTANTPGIADQNTNGGLGPTTGTYGPPATVFFNSQAAATPPTSFQLLPPSGY